MRAGRLADEPAALVQSATAAEQRSVHAPLSEIASRAAVAGVVAPAVLIVGPTVSLAEVLGGSNAIDSAAGFSLNSTSLVKN